MANGKGRRWGNYGGIPKHLITVEGETLLERTTRLVHVFDDSADVIITSANPDCEALGATRHVPQRNDFEIDRFCYELIEDNTCFLYGDVFYTVAALHDIVDISEEPITFFGNSNTIVCVKVVNGDCMKLAVDDLREQVMTGKLPDAKGWQLYHYIWEMDLAGRAIGDGMHLIEDATRDFNYPEDWKAFRDQYL